MKKYILAIAVGLAGAQMPLIGMDQDQLEQAVPELKGGPFQKIDRWIQEKTGRFYESLETTGRAKKRIYQGLYWSSLIGLSIANTNIFAPGDDEAISSLRHVLQLILAETITKSLENKNGLYVVPMTFLSGVISNYVIYESTGFDTGFNILGILTAATSLTDRLKIFSDRLFKNKPEESHTDSPSSSSSKPDLESNDPSMEKKMRDLNERIDNTMNLINVLTSQISSLNKLTKTPEEETASTTSTVSPRSKDPVQDIGQSNGARPRSLSAASTEANDPSSRPVVPTLTIPATDRSRSSSDTTIPSGHSLGTTELNVFGADDDLINVPLEGDLTTAIN